MTRFNREQLVLMAYVIITAAWDRIQAFLPSNASDIADYESRPMEVQNIIHGIVSTVASGLPILYAQVSGDGMGIGDFAGFTEFEQQVEDFIKATTDPNRPADVSHPNARPMAEAFVDKYLDA